MDSALSRLVLSNDFGYRIARHTIFWSACVLFFGTIYGNYWNFAGDPPLFKANSFVEALLYLPLHMFLGYAIIYFLFPRCLFTEKYLQLFLGIVVLILFTAALSWAISLYVINPYRTWQGLPVSPNVLPNGLMAGLRGSNTVAGFMVAIKLVKYWYFKKVENEELRHAKLWAELEVLKGQLQPHFLFNTLNNLYSLILQKSTDAAHVVIKLSEVLQYMLTESTQSRIPLSRELDILRQYIALEQIRFGDRLDLTMHVNGSPEKKIIAPLILLPFVENAFKHGSSEVLEQPWVSLDITIRESQISFKLINGKPAKQEFTRMNTGLGLSNVRTRLSLLYGNRHELRTEDQGETYLVCATLPLESE